LGRGTACAEASATVAASMPIATKLVKFRTATRSMKTTVAVLALRPGDAYLLIQLTNG
jgi:hypothetical protein